MADAGATLHHHPRSRVCSDGEVPRRADLAQFLVARRTALAPAEVGLPAGGRRRTAGLRREEVAMLAGVSVSWYTWLEQGRPINASAEVLDALARALRLDTVERDHLHALAGHPLRRPIVPGRDTAPAALQALLDALEPHPAYVLGPRWDVLAWNRAQERLYPAFRTVAPEDRNLVWLVFCEPSARALIGDWEIEARAMLSQFRAETVPLRDDPAVVRLIDRLRAESPVFDEWWPRYDVAGFQVHERRFHHATAGTLRFQTTQVVPADGPDLRVVTHLGLPGDDSVDRLARAGLG
jgi:transcriptional regulator with XRE-family HTH domain